MNAQEKKKIIAAAYKKFVTTVEKLKEDYRKDVAEIIKQVEARKLKKVREELGIK